MFLEYAMMEDRLRSILCHSNLTKTKKSEYLDIPETKQEVINIYNNIYNTDKEIKKLKLNEIRTKIEIIEALIKWTSMNIDSENQIQEDLKNKFSDLEVYIEFFKSLKEWCTYRNHLIHAIFDKNIDSVNEELLSMEIINLVSNGYIELSVDNNGRETFTLDGTIEKLGVVLEALSNGNCASLRQEKLSLIVNYVETTYQRLCTAQDLIIINAWIDNNCDYEDIKEAVLKSVKMGKMNLKYAEAILYSKSRREVKAEIEIDDELKALLDGAYIKK
jgi:hypothetical protein